jgi:hypothetical protein
LNTKKIIKRHICILPRRRERRRRGGEETNPLEPHLIFVGDTHPSTVKIFASNPWHHVDGGVCLLKKPAHASWRVRASLTCWRVRASLTCWHEWYTCLQLFSFYFFNLSKDHTSLYPTWYQWKNQHEKIRKPLDASYIFFCLQGYFNNCTMFLKRKNQKYTNWKLRKLNI